MFLSWLSWTGGEDMLRLFRCMAVHILNRSLLLLPRRPFVLSRYSSITLQDSIGQRSSCWEAGKGKKM